VHLTATHCRAQQAIQLAKAESEPLESRKKIALVAAAAWDAEATDAEKREGKSQSPQDQLDAAITQEFAREVADDARAKKMPPSHEL
jgi:hypothetical protein